MLEIRILGPVELHVSGRPVALPRRHHRTLLRRLALEAPRPVSIDRLIDALWPDRPPVSHRANLATRISELRAIIVSAAAEAGTTGFDIRATANGYQLEAPEESIDAHVFMAAAGTWRQGGDLEAARVGLRQALALWRGPVLGDDTGATAAEALDSARVVALEDLFDIELALGRHGDVVEEIRQAAARHPTRERLLRQLMVALYRTGRGGEALHTYDGWRRWLRDEIGGDPGAELRSLHLAILRDDADAIGSAIAPADAAVTAFRPAVPRTLPAAIGDLTGRDVELARLAELLDAGHPARIISITGRGGIGKTAVAVTAAHAAREAFADGQLFANLRAADRDVPAAPFDVLQRFLSALGVTGPSLPNTLDERVDLYRSLVADRRMLIVLDDAADDDQVTPLIPAGENAKVLVTSRPLIGAALGSVALRLDLLTEPDAQRLLGHMIGAERARTDPSGVAAVTRHCGRLPLAIRIAGAKLAARPHWPVHQLADMLRDEHRRLDHLRHGQLDIRASIQLSYTGLTPDAQRLLYGLSDLDLPEIPTWVGMALLDTDRTTAEATLAELADAQLLDAADPDHTGAPRHRLHDLIRLYAIEQAERHDRADLGRARERVYRAALDIASALHHRIHGGEYNRVRPRVTPWAVDRDLVDRLVERPSICFESERVTLRALVTRALRDSAAEIAVDLAQGVSGMLEMRRHHHEDFEMLSEVLAAAVVAGDQRGQAALLLRMSMSAGSRADYDQGKVYAEDALARFQEMGDGHSAAVTMTILGILRLQGGDDATAETAQGALVSAREHNDHTIEAFALRLLAQLHLDRGDVEGAARHIDEALRALRRVRSPHTLAQTLYWHGVVLNRQDRPDDAVRAFEDCMEICHEIGDPVGQVYGLRGLGLAHLRRGDIPLARETLHTALRLARQPTPTHAEESIRQSIAELPADAPPDAASTGSNDASGRPRFADARSEPHRRAAGSIGPSPATPSTMT